MRFLTNLFDPTHDDAKKYIITHTGETREEAWASQERWLRDKVVGRPQGTEAYSVEDLEAMNTVGIYAD